MIMRIPNSKFLMPNFFLALSLVSSAADARVVRLRIERRETVLNGRPFGAAGSYEKLIGRVDFGLDPDAPANAAIVDLKLAPRNARGEVESSADFYLLKPVDPRRGSGGRRLRSGEPRLSIEERYRNRDEYVGKYAAATLDLVVRGYVLPEDVADLLKHAIEHYDWAGGIRNSEFRIQNLECGTRVRI